MVSQLSEMRPAVEQDAIASSAGVARNQIRGSSLLLAGNVISLAITFLPHLLLVRYLSTEAFGHLAYALSIVAVCKTYALGFNEALSRFVPIYHTKHEHSKLLGSIVVVFAVTLLVSGIFIIAFLVKSGPILAFLTKGRETAGILSILMYLIPLETMSVLIMNLFACFERTRAIFFGRFIIPPGIRAIVIMLTIFWREGLSFLALGYLFAEAITVLPLGALLVWELRKQNLLMRVREICLPVREIFGFSVPLLASNVVGILGASLPVLLLGYFHPLSTVAYFRVVLPAAVLSNMILGNFMPLYMPAASRLFAKKDTHGINQLFWQTSLWMTALAFPVFLATTCFARPLTVFLYGERYAPSAPILALLSIGYLSNLIFGFNSVTLKVLGKIRLMVILNILTPILTVILNLLLIPKYGAIGAAAATSAGLIFHNLSRQVGLSVAGGVSFFDKQFLPSYLVLSLSAIGLYVVQFFTQEKMYIALPLAIAVSGMALWLIKKQLRIADTFPEIARIPIVGRHLA